MTLPAAIGDAGQARLQSIAEALLVTQRTAETHPLLQPRVDVMVTEQT